MPNLQLEMNIPVASRLGGAAGWSNVNILPTWPPGPPPPPTIQAVTTGFVVNLGETPCAQVQLLVSYPGLGSSAATEILDTIEFSIIAEGSSATDPPYSAAVVDANQIGLNAGDTVAYEVGLRCPIGVGTTYTLNIKVYGNYE